MSFYVPLLSNLFLWDLFDKKASCNKVAFGRKFAFVNLAVGKVLAVFSLPVSLWGHKPFFQDGMRLIELSHSFEYDLAKSDFYKNPPRSIRHIRLILFTMSYSVKCTLYRENCEIYPVIKALTVCVVIIKYYTLKNYTPKITYKKPHRKS